MKKSILSLFILFQSLVQSQVVGTPYVTASVDSQRLILDQLGLTPSFAFSTRKLRRNYTGFALRIRRSTDNAEADVAFDTNNIVSNNSILTVAVAGGGLTIGNTLNLASFISGSTSFVSIWYDQGTNGYHGTQSTISRQPVFSLGVAGLSNQYASLVFTGTAKHNVTVNQTLPVLLGSGLRGSVMMLAKVQAGVFTNISFGYSDVNDSSKRWSAHMNWPSDNNYTYTDFGSSFDASRQFLNDATVGFNKLKQYTMIRNTTTKTVKLSGVIKQNNIALSVQSITWSAGSTFGVGLTTGSLDTMGHNGFNGNIPEFILFPDALTAGQYSLMENDQILFWGAF